MVKVRGVWTPKINYNEFAHVVLRVLAHKESRLTGNEIRFIRTYFKMTLQKFAKRFCVTHVAVLKWEKVKNQPTAMNWTTEKDIRLFVLSTPPEWKTKMQRLLQTSAPRDEWESLCPTKGS
jgi:hypothetical protein